jgi:hypothetical protein
LIVSRSRLAELDKESSAGGISPSCAIRSKNR